jgi:hypothetical protein
MRPTVNVDPVGQFNIHVPINITDYGYTTMTSFMLDYESLTFNFSFTMNGISHGGTRTNSKNYFTPVIIPLNQINIIADVNSQGSFYSPNIIYANNSGNYIDGQGN